MNHEKSRFLPFITWLGIAAAVVLSCLSIHSTARGQSASDGGSREELLSQRKEEAIGTWKRAFPNDEPLVLEAGDVILLGNVSQVRLEEIGKEFQQALVAIRRPPLFLATSPLRSAKPDPPLFSNGLAVFVLKSRYDYSEFGKMIESRELPREWASHWRGNSENPYVAIVDSNTTEMLSTAMACQLALAAYWGSKSNVPYWFAEGLARNYIPAKYRSNYRRMARWPFESLEATKRMPNTKSLVDGDLDEETQGLIGMKIVAAMMSGNNQRQFQSLIKQVRTGTDFSEAMNKTFGEPEAIIQYWLGK